MSNRSIGGVFCLALAFALATTAASAEEKNLGWSDSAELSYVATDGNSNTETIGFKNELRRTWERALFTFKLAGINAENTTVTREAVGTDPMNFGVTETESTEKTAEQFFSEVRYQRDVSKRLYWFAGAGWEQNVPAGIDNRLLGFGGVGNVWVDKEKISFVTDYAVSYTDQQDVVTDPTIDDTYAGARLSAKYDHKLTGTTTFSNETVVDLNFDESSRWRGNMVNSISVTISKIFALKASLRWLYENEPALEEIPLLDTGGMQIGTVLVPVDDLDTIFTTSLVANF